jgi:hypothetical protein
VQDCDFVVGDLGYAATLSGLKEAPVENITFRNVNFYPPGAETTFFGPIVTSKRSIYQDRLLIKIGKVEKERRSQGKTQPGQSPDRRQERKDHSGDRASMCTACVRAGHRWSPVRLVSPCARRIQTGTRRLRTGSLSVRSLSTLSSGTTQTECCRIGPSQTWGQ